VTVTDTLEAELHDALRAGMRERVQTLRLLRAALHNAQIEHGAPLSDEQALGVIQKQAKQRRDSIEAYEGGGRLDLADQERRELAIIETYLPRQLADGEIEAAAREAIAATAATGPQDMGRVMRALMPRLQGTADGRRVSDIVRSLLAG
jgi:uncharacterized protein YqeY